MTDEPDGASDAVLLKYLEQLDELKNINPEEYARVISTLEEEMKKYTNKESESLQSTSASLADTIKQLRDGPETDENSKGYLNLPGGKYKMYEKGVTPKV